MFGGEKDPPQRVLWVGWVVPAILVGLAIMNFWTGRVYWLAGRGAAQGLISFTDPMRFWGIVALKLGLATATFSWHVLANYPKHDQRAGPLAIAGIAVAAAGFIAYCAGFFR